MMSIRLGRGPDWSQISMGDAVIAALAVAAIAAVLWFLVRPRLEKYRDDRRPRP